MPRPIDPEVKARALADVALGETITSVAKRYGVTRRAIQIWRDKHAATHVAVTHEKNVLDLGVKVVSLIDETIDTLRVHARLARTPDWFFKQSAEGVAQFAYVHHEKLAQLLGALQRAAPADGVGASGANVYDND